MVRVLDQDQEPYKSKLVHFKGMYENGGRQTQRSTAESSSGAESPPDDRMISRSKALGAHRSRYDSAGAGSHSKDNRPSDIELMKERFSKLLLGEDMSGHGKGVSSALALSNAITNVAASVFGELRRLEPMPVERKTMWRREIDWLLSVSDHIVEMVPQQRSKDGTSMEVMVTRQRCDLLMNIPALRKLDAMLIDTLENFKDQKEFYYPSGDAKDSSREDSQRTSDKWWIPNAKVPPNGLSEVTRKWLQFQKDSVNQVLKAAMAINAQILSEMEIPENYIESLPKNGRASLGDSIYKSITVDHFDPGQFLSTMDLSSNRKILDLKNRIEASIVIWKRKMHNKDGKSAWASAVSLEKRELFEERAETILLIIKQRYPGLDQSQLDIHKIQFNQDVGHAILESYSRILETLAFTVLSRIEDVLYADSLAQNPALASCKRNPLRGSSSDPEPLNFPNPKEEIEKLSTGTPQSMTLSDFMGWNLEKEDGEEKKGSGGNSEELSKNDEKPMTKIANIITNKKVSYIEKLENLGGLRSPTARH
ncbi:rop guanine nucleotide exchange factor 12 isoform X1 [Vitis riparia]|uniref:rop guanine nucleotide exchange factor 12 isoform X1 n=1 Tax=Vitis riparia TaxID=96939 RepID=UPI00155A8E18|nr:rop guanine nucleotide exchange factor 12 isoform X1 [Vitis riparia]